MQTIVFTNGVFDCFHAGHRHLLSTGIRQGNFLVVALNKDASVKRLKGNSRPVDTLATRTKNVMAYLELLRPGEGNWEVHAFEGDTPEALICEIKPNILVKGSDAPRPLPGEEFVIRHGGQIQIVERLPNISTTEILNSRRSKQLFTPRTLTPQFSTRSVEPH